MAVSLATGRQADVPPCWLTYHGVLAFLGRPLVSLSPQGGTAFAVAAGCGGVASEDLLPAPRSPEDAQKFSELSREEYREYMRDQYPREQQ